MHISDKYKYIYLAIPHTKSWSMRGWLALFYNAGQVGQVHEVRIPKECEDYLVWTTVRNPLDRACALWRKIHRAGDKAVFEVRTKHPVPSTFGEFAVMLGSGVLNDFPKAQFMPQVQLLGDVVPSMIFRFESIPHKLTDLPFVHGHLDEFPHANKNKVLPEATPDVLYGQFPGAREQVLRWAPGDLALWEGAR
jgi:hypothetical protein